MRLGRLALATVLAGGLAACGVSISGINERPDKYYQEKLAFSARVTRVQRLASTMLLEVADATGARIIVRVTPPVEVAPDDWVHVEGVLVPESRVEDVVVYDVVVAEKVSPTHAPWIPEFM